MPAWMRRALRDSNAHTTLFKFTTKFIFISVLCFLMMSLLSCKDYGNGMLNPKGLIAYEERKLFFDTLALMLIVVLPVIVMSFTFVYHYQISHRVKDYKPNWDHSYFLESLWWGIPCVIIFILAVVTWIKTHELDPYNRIPGQTDEPMLIQAIALPWKWLFIYPEENIASVNYLVVPVGRQVEYWFTTDNVPMSAFYIPQLGSQIYTMAGMRTRLHLLANEIGTYDGLNTQYNGSGFSDMHFPVHVVQPNEMQQWVNEVKKSPNQLTEANYIKLLNPSIGSQPQFYSGVEKDIFDNVIHLYMNSLGAEHPRSNQAKFYNPV